MNSPDFSKMKKDCQNQRECFEILQSIIDGEWFPGCEWTSEIAEAVEAQQRWRALGYNTVIRERQEHFAA